MDPYKAVLSRIKRFCTGQTALFLCRRFFCRRFFCRPLFSLFILSVLFLALFYPRSYAPDPVFPQGAYYEAAVQGRIRSYQPGEDSLTLSLQDCRIAYEGQDFSCGRLRVSVAAETMGSLPPLKAGMLLSVEGALSSFQPARNPGNFDWNAYYLALHIPYSLSARTVSVLDPQPSPLREWLLQARISMAARLDELANAPDMPPSAALPSGSLAPVLKALLLGDKSGLDEEIQSRYETGGILHILSVSGLHVSLLGGALVTLAKRLRLPLWLQKLSASLLIVLYWQFCGASLSSGRAAVMFLCLSAAPLLGRSYDSLSALSLAGLLLLWDSPGLLFQASFQLSFGAILAILLVCPAFAPLPDADPKPKLPPGRRPDPPSLRRALIKLFSPLPSLLSFGLGLQLALLPVTLYHFFRYPLYGILLNLAVLPLTAPLFLCGTAGLLLAFLWMPAGAALLLPCRLILLFYDFLCARVSALPMASCLLGRPAPVRILLYYAALALLCLLRQKARGQAERRPSRPAAGTPLPAAKAPRAAFLSKAARPVLPLLLLLLLLPPLPGGALTVVFLDIGQGDCAFLRTPAGTTLLIDGGSSDVRSAAEERLIPFLESQAVDSLDYVFLSHSDDDHVNAVLGWLASGRFVGCLILPSLPASLAAEESYQKLLSLARDYGVPLLFFHEGSVWREGGLTLSCLAPAAPDAPQAGRYSSLNAASQVLLAEYQGIRFLFTGDCGEEGEELLLETLCRQNLSCHILKAGHHGSAGSTGPPLLEQLDPLLAVISCGIRNRYRHPHPDMLSRLAEQEIPCFVTARCGAVTVWIQNGKIRLQTMLPTDIRPEKADFEEEDE